VAGCGKGGKGAKGAWEYRGDGEGNGKLQRQIITNTANYKCQTLQGDMQITVEIM